jgi:hypothetical protein
MFLHSKTKNKYPVLNFLKNANRDTIEDISKIIGTSFSACYQKIIGNSFLKVGEAKRLAKHYGISTDLLFSEKSVDMKKLFEDYTRRFY